MLTPFPVIMGQSVAPGDLRTREGPSSEDYQCERLRNSPEITAMRKIMIDMVM